MTDNNESKGPAAERGNCVGPCIYHNYIIILTRNRDYAASILSMPMVDRSDRRKKGMTALLPLASLFVLMAS